LVPKPAPLFIAVEKRDQRMVVTVDGWRRFKWKIRTGARGYAIMSGHYKLNWLDQRHKSKQYNAAPMPFAIVFESKCHG
jgi:hypothetical protein